MPGLFPLLAIANNAGGERGCADICSGLCFLDHMVIVCETFGGPLGVPCPASALHFCVRLGYIIHRSFLFSFFFASLISPLSTPCPLLLAHSCVLASEGVCSFCREVLCPEAQTSLRQFVGREEERGGMVGGSCRGRVWGCGLTPGGVVLWPKLPRAMWLARSQEPAV